MTSDEKLRQVIGDIFRELYANCEPKLDYDKAIAKGGKARRGSGHTNWFCEHYISENDEQRIIQKHMKKNKLKSSDIRYINWALLDMGPTNSRECMLRERRGIAAKKKKILRKLVK